MEYFSVQPHLSRRRRFLTSNIVSRIALGGFLHDLGKVSVPDAMLKKLGKLTAEEYIVVKTRSEVGSRLLSDFVRFVVVLHHKTPDGHGCPHGLTSEQISLDGSIARRRCNDQVHALTVEKCPLKMF